MYDLTRYHKPNSLQLQIPSKFSRLQLDAGTSGINIRLHGELLLSNQRRQKRDQTSNQGNHGAANAVPAAQSTVLFTIDNRSTIENQCIQRKKLTWTRLIYTTPALKKRSKHKSSLLRTLKDRQALPLSPVDLR